MIQATPSMRILVAVDPVDFRCGIDGLGGICRRQLAEDPMSGCMFVFRNRKGTAVKILVYDGQGYWLCQKRLSAGRFPWWPGSDKAVRPLEAHQLQVLLAGGNADAVGGVEVWQAVKMVKMAVQKIAK